MLRPHSLRQLPQSFHHADSSFNENGHEHDSMTCFIPASIWVDKKMTL